MTPIGKELDVSRLRGGRRKPRIRARGKTWARILDLLWYQQGNVCFYRYPSCSNTKQVIAHKDHDPSNWDPSNLAAACTNCNRKISNLGRLQNTGVAKENVRGRRSDHGIESPSSLEVQINKEFFPRYKAWFYEEISSKGHVTVKHGIHGGAYYLKERWGHGSSSTTRRWLNDLTSELGPFEVFDHKVDGPSVRFRSDPARLDNEVDEGI